MSETFSADFDATDRERATAPTVIAPPGAATICNSLRAVYKRLLGRGPKDVRLWFLQPDTIIMLLAGTLTASERSLLDVGQPAIVLAARIALYDALEPELRTILEQELHRKTKAFIPGIDLKRDIVSLVVTLS
ncbi:MAG TPA: Na-translocating system protein MpsC family protein [Solirubrobacteraceae bacterium]|jgi:uncharacterized protein YbcI|nr:Na-translocating system protein MpsC family protein [Solirubrobacteraceae bacterium]